MNLSEEIEQAVNEIVKCLKKGNKIVIFGNGGSAADAQHISAEFIGRFQKERESLSAISLTRSEEHTSELKSRRIFVCRLLP